ncbi:MAG: integrin alpha [Geminicoccaceae bacterium]
MLDPLPARTDRAALEPNLINGTDASMLTLAAGGDLRLTLVDQLAGYRNSVGVYRIADDGSFVDPRIVVTDTKGAALGSEILMSEVYGVDDFAAGTRFGLFLIADGGTKNALDRLESDGLAFVDNRDGSLGGSFTAANHLTLVDTVSGQKLGGNVFHTTDGDPGDALGNSLNKGGEERTVSAWGEAPGEAWIAFEDLRDFDFDDLTLKVESLPAPVEPPPEPESETARLVRFDGIGAGDRAGHAASIIGDFNGDGFADIAIGAPHADVTGADGVVREGAGAVYLFFGTDAAIPPIVPVASFDGTNGVAILGAEAGGRFGWAVAGAGDVDGDGLADLVAGAPGPGASGDGAGEAVLLYGAVLDGSPVIDLAAADQAAALRPTVLAGTAAGDETGISVAGGGDIDGDGFADIVIGARLGEAEYASYNGGLSYVVRGQAGGLGERVELASLDGEGGFRVEGRAMFDQSGRSVAMLGDVNGDGLDDVAISGQDASPNGLAKAGEAYVVFGQAGARAASLDPGDLDGSDGFIIEGVYENGFAGFGLAGAGDLNGDGFGDIVVGAYAAPRPDLGPDGAAYVIFGTDQGFSGRFSLGDLDGANGFAMRGPANGDGFGRSVAGVGDVDGDGFDDLLVGARYADRLGAEGGGEAFVIFGRETFGAELDLASLIDDTGGILGGWRIDGHLGFTVAGGGDVDGDGFDDLLVGEPFDIAAALDPQGLAGSTYLAFGEPGLGPKLPALDQIIADGNVIA